MSLETSACDVDVPEENRFMSLQLSHEEKEAAVEERGPEGQSGSSSWFADLAVFSTPLSFGVASCKVTIVIRSTHRLI